MHKSPKIQIFREKKAPPPSKKGKKQAKFPKKKVFASHKTTEKRKNSIILEVKIWSIYIKYGNFNHLVLKCTKVQV